MSVSIDCADSLKTLGTNLMIKNIDRANCHISSAQNADIASCRSANYDVFEQCVPYREICKTGAKYRNNIESGSNDGI